MATLPVPRSPARNVVCNGMATTTKKKTAAQIAADINGALGKDVVQMASDPRYVVTHISTGVLPVDVLLDGGLPRGRITEFYGPYSSLKSYIGLCAIAECQSEGGVAALVDAEHAFDPVWAGQIGVDVPALIISRPNTGEEACDAVQIALARGADLIVWDSVASTQPAADSTVQMSGDKKMQPARLAAFMSTALNRLNTVNKDTAMLFINQTRSKVGVVFGSPETTPGGHALPFYASIRVKFVKAGRITESRQMFDGEKMATVHDTTVQKIRVELVKTKLSRAEREQWFQWDTRLNEIDTTGYLIAVGIEHGKIKRPPKGQQQWKMGRKTYRGEKGIRAALEASPKSRAELRAIAVSAGSGVPLK